MPLPLAGIFGGALSTFARRVFGGVVISQAFSWFKRIFVGSGGAAGWLGRTFEKLKDIVFSLGTIGWVVSVLGDIGKKIIGIFGVGGAVSAGGASVVQIKRLLSSINDPQAALLDYLHSAVQHLPTSFSTILSSLDSQLTAATSDFFSPAISVTYILRVTGVGEAFNQIVMALIQSAVFIFSVYLVRWAFSSNFTYVKTDPKRPN